MERHRFSSKEAASVGGFVIGRGLPRQIHRQLHRFLTIMMGDFLSKLADRRARLGTGPFRPLAE
jgi:hypothetical protein